MELEKRWQGTLAGVREVRVIIDLYLFFRDCCTSLIRISTYTRVVCGKPMVINVAWGKLGKSRSDRVRPEHSLEPAGSYSHPFPNN